MNKKDEENWWTREEYEKWIDPRINNKSYQPMTKQEKIEYMEKRLVNAEEELVWDEYSLWSWQNTPVKELERSKKIDDETRFKMPSFLCDDKDKETPAEKRAEQIKCGKRDIVRGKISVKRMKRYLNHLKK